MDDQTAMPWSRTDIPEFPEAARVLDFDTLIKRKEALLAPGERYSLTWSDPAATPPQHALASTLELRTSRTEMPKTGTFTNHDVSTPAAAPPERAANKEGDPVVRRPSPVAAKKQRTSLTKTNWKTMDYQDTDSEQ